MVRPEKKSSLFSNAVLPKLDRHCELLQLAGGTPTGRSRHLRRRAVRSLEASIRIRAKTGTNQRCQQLAENLRPQSGSGP